MARDLVTVQFVSSTGEPLGTTQIDRAPAPPTLPATPVRTRRGTFVAEALTGGGFRYRQVDTERNG